jgi:hypothetical protein
MDACCCNRCGDTCFYKDRFRTIVVRTIVRILFVVLFVIRNTAGVVCILHMNICVVAGVVVAALWIFAKKMNWRVAALAALPPQVPTAPLHAYAPRLKCRIFKIRD